MKVGYRKQSPIFYMATSSFCRLAVTGSFFKTFFGWTEIDVSVDVIIARQEKPQRSVDFVVYFMLLHCTQTYCSYSLWWVLAPGTLSSARSAKSPLYKRVRSVVAKLFCTWQLWFLPTNSWNFSRVQALFIVCSIICFFHHDPHLLCINIRCLLSFYVKIGPQLPLGQKLTLIRSNTMKYRVDPMQRWKQSINHHLL